MVGSAVPTTVASMAATNIASRRPAVTSSRSRVQGRESGIRTLPVSGEPLDSDNCEMAKGTGSKKDPWQLTTPSGSSDYVMYRDESLDPPAIVCKVGSTELRYRIEAIADLHALR